LGFVLESCEQVERLEAEVGTLQKALSDKEEQEQVMVQVGLLPQYYMH
jgi:hypothetical protein